MYQWWWDEPLKDYFEIIYIIDNMISSISIFLHVAERGFVYIVYKVGINLPWLSFYLTKYRSGQYKINYEAC